MKRRKKLPYVIIILACIFLLIPFAATLVYSFTIGWTKLFPAGWTFKYWIQAFTEPTLWPAILRGVLISIPSDSDLQHRCNSGSVYFSGLLSKT